MNRIDQRFAEHAKLFIPYLTAGFPTVDATDTALDTLVENGADIIELGLPFSDPTADGPVIQASSKAALDAGFTTDHYFAILEAFRARHPGVPVVVFSYFNPIFHRGVERFADSAAAAGADAMLIVDLPFEEQPQMREILARNKMHLIQLIAPTTPDERARRILAHAGGFVYQIAVRGVTGMRRDVTDESAALVQRAKALTDVPVALGFGVSSGAQARAVAQHADGVIVGSAIVNCIADHRPDFAPALAALTRELAEATRPRR